MRSAWLPRRCWRSAPPRSAPRSKPGCRRRPRRGRPGPSLMPLSRQQAELRNASIGIQSDVGPAARPFLSAAYSGTAAARALECLATAVYYEAASEPLDTQRAVAQVVLNRMRHASYPNSICGVVFEGSSRQTGCQFTFTCDGALQRRRPGCRRLAHRHADRRPGAGRLRPRAGRARHPLPRRLGGPLLEHQPGQGRQVRDDHLLSLARFGQPAERLHQPLLGRRADQLRRCSRRAG